ncbi:MAG: hypothetical protein IJO45_06540 [Oscillospiraceae bacterium]|nr:hypothetical protein [Oscillospiraceae bacterium]
MKRILTGVILLLGGLFKLIYLIAEEQWIGLTGSILLVVGLLGFYFFVVLSDKQSCDCKENNGENKVVMIGVLKGLLIAFYVIGFFVVIINSLYKTTISNWVGFVLILISVVLGIIIPYILNRKRNKSKSDSPL